ncbi:type IV toxin-antitoxin system AbiEi family antitoxin [Janthinobacterium sp. LB3P112]|uniref:type IV toxin-antitoxin system AbiEi family antitoxin n=1 Tax=Janthinobacterium sp. LB3P112 TaxID=3424196 RepID=UPI003F21B377
MNKMQAMRTLAELDRQGVYVLTKGDLAKAFSAEQEKALEKSLQRLVSDGIVQRVARGVYLNPMAKSKTSRVVEDIAAVLRRGHYSYVSRESMLSEYGVISQVPMRRITLMTTGTSGVYDTPYGTIEFTHTKRRPAEIIRRTVSVKDRPLRLATKEAAVRDLVRSGRNVNMMDAMELTDG